MDNPLFNLQRKVLHYKEVLQQSVLYRKAWQDELKEEIIRQLTHLSRETGLEVQIEEKKDLKNLEAIVLSLGAVRSGLYKEVNPSFQKDLVKHNGALIYQQLFNGKIVVLIQYPFIEGYGEPKPPKTIAIYRPGELQPPFFIRHLEAFISEITLWEDYDDDDEPAQRIGFNMNFSNSSDADEGSDE